MNYEEGWRDEAMTDLPACYIATRLSLVEALRGFPLTAPMTRDALVKMADALLAQMPVASPGRLPGQLLQDLVDVLGEAEGFIGGKDNAAFTRLAEAAGVA